MHWCSDPVQVQRDIPHDTCALFKGNVLVGTECKMQFYIKLFYFLQVILVTVHEVCLLST